ncbi:HNH endonuclease signature motif containing protein [Leucobacter sp. HY1908]
MEAKPSPQHEEPLAGLFTEAASEGADAGLNDAAAAGVSGVSAVAGVTDESAVPPVADAVGGAGVGAAGRLGMQAKCDEIVQLMAHVQSLFPADCPGADARTVVNALTDEGASDFAKIVAQVMRKCSELEVLSAGVVGSRSVKRAGRPGVAQASGFKTGVEMMQHLTGSSWGEASRKVRVGQSMLAGETAEREAREQREALAARFGACTSDTGDGADGTADGSGGDDGDLAGVDAAASAAAAAEAAAAEAVLVLAVPWHTVLDRAVSRDLLTDPQNDAIRQGLGAPPHAPEPDTHTADAPTGATGATTGATANAAASSTTSAAAAAAVAPACAFHTAAYAALHTSHPQNRTAGNPADGTTENPAGGTTDGTANGSTGAFLTTSAGFFDAGSCGGRCEAALLVLWWQAGLDLVGAAQHTRVEELRRQARAIRDLLDPDGATLRRNQRYEARSFRWWTDQKGQFHARLTCDDDAGAWIGAIFASALRPRRGGPRFIDPDEQAAGDELAQDQRSHEQISHDLLIDLLQSGAVADQKTVFGTQQVGVRVVQVVNREAYLAEQAEARAAEAAAEAAKAAKKAAWQAARGKTPAAQQPTGAQAPGAQTTVAAPASSAAPVAPAAPADPIGVVAWYEDGLTITSDAVVAKQRCNAGVVHVTVDEDYNPLDVGREQRLYNGAQRIALATRDGGCRWPGCDRPASYCEAHHIDHWHSDQGRTDIDRGIALCSAHHLQLHNYGWKITRDGRGPFMLHPPPGPEGTAPPIILENPPPSATRAPQSPPGVTGRPDLAAATARAAAPTFELTQTELATPLPITYGMQLGAARARRFKPADQRAYAQANGYA